MHGKRARLLIAGLALALGGQTYRTVPADLVPQLPRFDFQPVSGSYDARWRQGPKDDLAWADLKLYQMTIEMPDPADFDYAFNLRVMVGDAKVGLVRVKIARGQSVATTTYLRNEGATETPDGTSNLTNGQFWLGCTTPKGKLRGNSGRSEVQSGTVRLRLDTDRNRASTGHLVRCVR